jgi:hypoxanthine phosphoribosyltransferase
VTHEEALALRERADLICDEAAARAAVARVATELTARVAARMPLVLSVMSGASVFCGQLLPQLDFPLELDYIHATRYGNATRGSHIVWRVEPREDVAGRTIVVLDDILDEGLTLAAVKEVLLAKGAREVLIAVFCEKELERSKPVRADFVGVRVPDRYVFGYGMDVHGWWRNLPAVYALKEENP